MPAKFQWKWFYCTRISSGPAATTTLPHWQLPTTAQAYSNGPLPSGHDDASPTKSDQDNLSGKKKLTQHNYKLHIAMHDFKESKRWSQWLIFVLVFQSTVVTITTRILAQEIEMNTLPSPSRHQSNLQNHRQKGYACMQYNCYLGGLPARTISCMCACNLQYLCM